MRADHHPDDSRHRHVDVVRRVMDALTALDVDGVAQLVHDDLVFRLPYERSVPDLDKAGFLELLAATSFTLYRQFTITLTHVYDVADDDTLIARYVGDCIGHDDVRYANDYVGIFAFRDGRISDWREYDNPMIVAAAQAEHTEARARSAS